MSKIKDTIDLWSPESEEHHVEPVVTLLDALMDFADVYFFSESKEDESEDNEVQQLTAPAIQNNSETEADPDLAVTAPACSTAELAKRKLLLKWCQDRTASYANVKINDFDESWSDGLALCALIHSYLPDKIPFIFLSSACKLNNFRLGLGAAESVGILNTLNAREIVKQGKPFGEDMMNYIDSVYQHFET